MSETVVLPDPALVVLVGPSGSGKSVWAADDRSAASEPAGGRASTPGSHVGRYRLLADRGVSTVFVSLPQLTDAEDVLCLTPLAAAFG